MRTSSNRFRSSLAALAVTGVAFTGLAAASPAAGAQSESATAYPPLPCKGGYLRMAAPARSGNVIWISSVPHCNAFKPVGLGRSGYIDARLDQYRGLGIWRNKAHKSHSVNNKAFTVALQPKWKCSGGNQLYRNHTKGWIAEGLRGRVSFSRSEQRRIYC